MRHLVPTIVPTSYLYFPRTKKHVAFLNQNNLVFSAFLGIIWTYSVNTGYLTQHNKQNGEKNQSDKQTYKCNLYLGENFVLACKSFYWTWFSNHANSIHVVGSHCDAEDRLFRSLRRTYRLNKISHSVTEWDSLLCAVHRSTEHFTCWRFEIFDVEVHTIGGE